MHSCYLILLSPLPLPSASIGRQLEPKRMDLCHSSSAGFLSLSKSSQRRLLPNSRITRAGTQRLLELLSQSQPLSLSLPRG